MMTSPFEWKILKREGNPKQTNKQNIVSTIRIFYPGKVNLSPLSPATGTARFKNWKGGGLNEEEEIMSFFVSDYNYVSV